jgi:hypothetical protein
MTTIGLRIGGEPCSPARYYSYFTTFIPEKRRHQKMFKEIKHH